MVEYRSQTITILIAPHPDDIDTELYIDHFVKIRTPQVTLPADNPDLPVKLQIVNTKPDKIRIGDWVLQPGITIPNSNGQTTITLTYNEFCKLENYYGCNFTGPWGLSINAYLTEKYGPNILVFNNQTYNPKFADLGEPLSSCYKIGTGTLTINEQIPYWVLDLIYNAMFTPQPVNIYTDSNLNLLTDIPTIQYLGDEKGNNYGFILQSNCSNNKGTYVTDNKTFIIQNATMIGTYYDELTKNYVYNGQELVHGTLTLTCSIFKGTYNNLKGLIDYDGKTIYVLFGNFLLQGTLSTPTTTTTPTQSTPPTVTVTPTKTTTMPTATTTTKTTTPTIIVSPPTPKVTPPPSTTTAQPTIIEQILAWIRSILQR